MRLEARMSSAAAASEANDKEEADGRSSGGKPIKWAAVGSGRRREPTGKRRNGSDADWKRQMDGGGRRWKSVGANCQLQLAKLLLAAVVTLIFPLASALKVTVSIPELVKLNDPFWLNCSQAPAPEGSSLPREEIYAIKWYKDNEEFYRFLPNAHPKVSIYETNGVQLDQTRSHEGNVLVSKADVNSEALYRCEIIAEAPLFETVAKSRHLRVYALPVRGPRIEILDAQGKPKSFKVQDISYAVGDRIELRCNSAPSKPAARLRWYLNDHELQVPNQAANQSTAPSAARFKRRAPLGAASSNNNNNVRVGPIEYRQHYKNIYSSHSSLSLLLQQEDLINNKISFKCLASMRQPVPLRSKQLIVLTPPPPPTTTTASSPAPSDPPAAARRRRQIGGGGGGEDKDEGAEPVEEPAAAGHRSQRQRPQHHRHSISRLSGVGAKQARPGADDSPDHLGLISGLASDQLMYIYEEADSTLGSTLLQSPLSLQAYLGLERPSSGASNQGLHDGSNSLEFNRAADNLELVQLMRERQARSGYHNHNHRLQQQQSSSTANGSHQGVRRLHGSSLLSKSPLYLDELDALRPVVSWPPLDSGRLLLLDGGSSLVAVPTRRRGHLAVEPAEAKFVLPPNKPAGELDWGGARSNGGESSSAALISPILDRLINSLNCTCTESSSETRLSWLVDETPLDPRNTRTYSSRVSPDHKQTWLTIGLLLSSHPPNTLESRFAPVTSASSSPPQTLQTILAHYFHKTTPLSPQEPPFSRSPAGPTTTTTTNGLSKQQISGSRQTNENGHIKFACQAIHSMLLYSSSEMITFDFNPPPPSPFDGPLPATQSNSVIQATSASQSSSAQALYTDNSVSTAWRSQAIFLALFLSTSLLLFTNQRQQIHS